MDTHAGKLSTPIRWIIPRYSLAFSINGVNLHCSLFAAWVSVRLLPRTLQTETPKHFIASRCCPLLDELPHPYLRMDSHFAYRRPIEQSLWGCLS